MEFTLYCFAKTFYLPYSGEPKYKNSLHLGNFFNCENGADSFFKLTRGETSGNKWINRISLNLEVCSAIQDEIVQYVYRKVIQQFTGNLKKEQLLEILLKYSLNIPKEKQQQIYAKRNTKEVVDYINSLKQMDETQFQSDENLSQYLEENIFTNNNVRLTNTTAPDFFEENLLKFKISEIDFMFCGGTEWLRNDHRVILLDELKEKNISCRIIINSDSEIIEKMVKHMGHPDRTYTIISQNIDNWYEYQKKYPLFHVKISPLPILHCYYHIKTEYAEDSVMRLHYYTYKNAYIRENYAQLFNTTSPYYQLYTEEYEYLWNLSSDIEEYIKNNS